VEVGLKGDFLEGRLRVNAALFHTDYRDMQLAQIYNLDQPDGVRVQGNTILNAASAEIRGVEVDVTLIPVDSLTLKASIAYLDAQYERFNPLNPTLGTHFDMSGESLQNAPEWTASTSALYEFALWGGTAAARVEYNYTDEKYLTNLFNVPRSLIQATHLVNTNLEWTPADGRWSLSLWARNLLDERYLSSGFETTGFNAFVSYVSPRRAGIALSYNW